MWYHGFGTRTEIELGASARLFVLFLFAHGLVFVALVMAALPFWLQCSLAVLNGLALRWHLLCWAFPGEHLQAERVSLTPVGRFLLEGGQGGSREWYLASVVWSWPFLQVLRLFDPVQRCHHYLVLAGDAVCVTASRRLRVRLRWGGIERRLGPLGRLCAPRPVGRQ